MSLLIPFAVALLSGFVHGSIGMGYGIISMSLMPLVYDYTDAAAIVSIPIFIVSAQICWSIRGSIDWKTARLPCATLTAGKALGVVLLMNLTSSVLQMVLGLFLAAYAASQLLGRTRFQLRGTPEQGIALNFIGGLLAGMINIAGPLSSIYFQAVCGEDKEKYSACMNIAFLPATVIGLILHVLYGNFRIGRLGEYAAMTVGTLIATHLGLIVLKWVPVKIMRLFTLCFVGIMGVFLCLSR